MLAVAVWPSPTGAFVVFFSSRRRHTRYWRDWSSDVCSSDLAITSGHVRAAGLDVYSKEPCTDSPLRSEERRVGKECRSRRSPRHQRTKGRGAHKHVPARQTRTALQVSDLTPTCTSLDDDRSV